MELRVTQPVFRDTIQRRRRDDAAERARRAEADVVGHDEQHVGRTLGRHDARRPPRLRLRGFLLDHPAEFRIGRRKLISGDGRGGVRRTQLTSDLLCDAGRGREREGDGAKRYRNDMFDCVHTSSSRLDAALPGRNFATHDHGAPSRSAGDPFITACLSSSSVRFPLP